MNLTIISEKNKTCFICNEEFLIKIENKSLHQEFYLCEKHYYEFIFDYGFVNVLSTEEINKIISIIDSLKNLRISSKKRIYNINENGLLNINNVRNC